jgi:fimbrial chaperone protein
MSTTIVHKSLFSIATLIAGLLLSSWPSLVLADLMLYPTRVVMEKNQRAAQVEIVNRGTKPETYRISLVNRRMSETGEIVEVKEAQAGEQFATDMVRYSPRQVTLQPGVAQTVRINVRKPADLATGEYRSHLQFDRVPDVAGQSDIESLAKPEEGQIAIVLQALIGASIPVIVRHGETSVAAKLENLAIEAPQAETPALLAFSIHREGNRSLYGDLFAEFTPAGGKPIEVAKVNGVAVYVPNDLRKSRLPLKLPEGMSLKNGTLSLRFMDRPEAGGKLIAQSELAVP